MTTIFRVNIGASSLTPLASISPAPIATIAFDPARHVFYFTVPDGSLSTFDLASGLISEVPMERCCPAMFVAGGAGVPVPLLSPVALVALGVGLVLAGWLALSRSVAG